MLPVVCEVEVGVGVRVCEGVAVAVGVGVWVGVGGTPPVEVGVAVGVRVGVLVGVIEPESRKLNASTSLASSPQVLPSKYNIDE